MIYLIIYLVGYVSSFVYLIYEHRKEHDVYIEDIITATIISLLSWILIIILLYYILHLNKKVIIKKRKEK